MTRAHFFIVLAAFFGFCSIVFDQIAYQYEKSSSSLQIEINVLSEKSEELSVLNKENGNFIQHLDELIIQYQMLLNFFNAEFASVEADKSFHDKPVPCAIETLLRKQMIEIASISKRYMALSSLSKFLEPAKITEAAEDLKLLEIKFSSIECKAMTGTEYEDFLATLWEIKENLDFIFKSGQLAYETQEKANELVFEKMEKELIHRFSLLAAISFNILSLVVLLGFFKTVNFRRLGSET